LDWVDSDIGYGVFATERIERGTITWVHDALDVEIPLRARLRRELYDPLLERYSYVRADGSRILPWDFTRYMNHSCAATSFLVGSGLEIAVRDVEVGEQLTSDYASLNLERAFACLCGSSECRHQVTPEDFERLAPQWDQAIESALAVAATVAQPLTEWFARDTQFAAWLRQPGLAPSILETRYHPQVRFAAPNNVVGMRRRKA
jgi:hypothetical protein